MYDISFLSKEVRIVIIYISKEENRQMLDQMAEQHEWELLAEAVDRASLNAFITGKLQLIANLRYLVFDRSCISETDRQLSEVVETVHVMWNTKVIMLTEELTDEEGRQQKVIYGEQITFLYKYQDDLVRKLEYLLNGEKIPEEELYEGVWIGVISANSGAGATHVSMGLANYIRQHGESVCYVEANESGDLGAMAAFYGLEQVEENHYRKDGIDYWHQSIDSNQRFAVLDLGKYSGMKSELFKQCRLKILVADGKPYRMADALTVLRYIDDEAAKLWLNFSNPEEYERVRETYLDVIKHETGRIEWHGDMFQGEDPLYQQVMREYIDTDADNRRVSFLISGDKLRGLLKRKPKEKLIKDDNVIDPEEQEEAISIPSEDWKTDEIVEEDEFPGESVFDDMEESRETLELPEPDDEFNQDILSDDDEKQQEERDMGGASDEGFREEDGRDGRDKRQTVNTYMIWLFFVIIAVYAATGIPIKKAVDHFFFNNQDSGQAATELVDEELNINPDIKISVLEVEGADGYEVSYSTDKDFDKKKTVVVEVETADKAVESLTAGKTYYVRVRAFKFNEDGTKVYGEYTEVQKIET